VKSREGDQLSRLFFDDHARWSTGRLRRRQRQLQANIEPLRPMRSGRESAPAARPIPSASSASVSTLWPPPQHVSAPRELVDAVIDGV
jgi:hypothetical protein